MDILPEDAIGQAGAGRFSLSQLALEIPNPYQPVMPHRGAAAPCQAKRWVAHNERRSHILAATRQLMGEQGDDAVSLRGVAAQCEISLPTIYNVVGDRNEVIRAALVEYIQSTAAGAITPAQPGAGQIFALLETLAAATTSYPRYNASAAKFAFASQAPSYAACRSALTVPVAHFLQRLRAQSVLRGSILIDALAWQMTELIHNTICLWTMQPYAHDQFRRDLAYGPSLMLIGALCGSEARKLDQRLETIMAGYSAAKRTLPH